MANVLHSSLTGAELHEPKAINTASQDTVYVANGSGTGAWTNHYTWAEAVHDKAATRQANTTGTVISETVNLGKLPWNATVDAISADISTSYQAGGPGFSTVFEVYNSSSGRHLSWTNTSTSSTFQVYTEGSLTNRNVTANTNTVVRVYWVFPYTSYYSYSWTLNNITVWFRQRN